MRAEAQTARRVANGAALGMLVFVALAFGILTYAFVTSDFSVALVADNSHTLKPLVYKISGVWGGTMKARCFCGCWYWRFMPGW